MSDLISRQALINKAEYEAEAMAEPFKSQLPVLVAWLAEKIPSEEPERKTGKWTYNSPVTMKCVQCGLVIKDWDWHRFKYCPNCDSVMNQKGVIQDEYSSGNLLSGMGCLLDLGNKEVNRNEKIVRRMQIQFSFR